MREWDGGRTALLTAGTISGGLPEHVTYVEGERHFARIKLVLNGGKLCLSQQKGVSVLFR